MNQIKLKTNLYEIEYTTRLLRRMGPLGESIGEKLMRSMIDDVLLRLELTTMKWRSSDPSGIRKRSLSMRNHEARTLMVIISRNIARIEHPHERATLELFNHNLGRQL
jgi:hypothetical protein